MLIRTEWRVGDIGALVQMHGELYARERGWDHTFEAYVALELGRFAERFDPSRDAIRIVEADGRRLGSIALVGGDDDTAQIRWFLVVPPARGSGIGKRLLSEAIADGRERGYRQLSLWTVAGLDAAARLYHDAGFAVVESVPHRRWGADVVEQRYALTL